MAAVTEGRRETEDDDSLRRLQGKKRGKAGTGGRRRCAHLHVYLQVSVRVWTFVRVFAD